MWSVDTKEFWAPSSLLINIKQNRQIWLGWIDVINISLLASFLSVLIKFLYDTYKLTTSIHCVIFNWQSLKWEVQLCQQFNYCIYNRCTNSCTYAFISQLCPNKIIWYQRISTELWKITQVIYKIWRFHGGKDSHCGLLGCDTM